MFHSFCVISCYYANNFRYDQKQNLEQYPGGGREFMGFNENSVLVGTGRDPCVYEYLGAVRNSTDESASVITSGGAKMVTPEEYMRVARCIRADIVVPMCDEVVADSKPSRIKTACRRTSEWVSRSLQIGCDDAIMLCPIPGGAEVGNRMACFDGVKALVQQYHGVCITGIGTGESFPQRMDIIKKVVENMTGHEDGKFRMVSTVSSPWEMLQMIALGVDAFDSSYISDTTRGGYALNFPLDPMGINLSLLNGTKGQIGSATVQEEGGERVYDAGQDGTKMNLWSSSYKVDARPIVQGCPCDTCCMHSRSYIHHLLVTHEMTGHVLLEQHNVLHMLQFMKAVRQVISDGRLKEYCGAWMEYQRLWATGVAEICNAMAVQENI